MPKARQIFPQIMETPYQVFNLVILSEGYKQYAPFFQDCMELVSRLKETPFLHDSSTWLSIHIYFQESMEIAPSIDVAPSSNASSFLSQYDTTTETLTVVSSRVNEVLNGLTLCNMNGDEVKISDWFVTGRPFWGPTGGAVLVLLPSMDVTTNGGIWGSDMENIPGENDYYFIATTRDGQWQQVVLRVLAKLQGLGDEFAIEKPEFLEPSPEEAQKIHMTKPNLVYLPEIPTGPLNATFKWWRHLSPAERSVPLLVHPFEGQSLGNAFAVSYDFLELWEGGGGFQKKVYRSAKDCLLRRRLGDPSLPVRRDKIDLCPICKKLLKGISATNSIGRSYA